MRIDALSIQAVVCLFYDFPCLIHASIGEYSIVLNRIFQPILSQGRLIHPMVYIAIKGLYTLLSRCIDPCNNRGVWVDKYAINVASLNVPRPTVGYHAATILGWVGCIFARTHFGFSY